jgi:hydroxylamine reductase (hybrid-cluster protein)
MWRKSKMEKMFCMQCEQTAGGKACLSTGVCGKTANTAKLQDELTGALITAARLGPSLPAFVSPNVLNYLVENFSIAPITTPEADLAEIFEK